MPTTNINATRVVEQIRSYRRCLVAFSGGVDSAVVAKAAQLALGDNAIAVTAVSPSLASGELDQAMAVAAAIGITHRQLATDEFSNPAYVQNASDRCYHCKSELYQQLEAMSQSFPETVIANGTNADDLGDYRPGLRAAMEHWVRSPLAECQLGKDEVRQLAAYFELPVWNKPATPCLSSRIAYGEEVTPQRLRMIDEAEKFLRQHGFAQVRVRYHHGDLARLEVPLERVAALAAEPFREQVCQRLKELGFCYVALDLQGFRSGSLNTLIPLEVLQTNSQTTE